MTAKKTLEKMLSVMIVALFITSPMAILLQNTGANQTPGEAIKSVSDMVIDGTTVDPVTGETGKFTINENTIDPITGQRGMYGQDGNITVANGGTLVVKNAKLYFLQDNGNDGIEGTSDDHHYWLTVQSGGTLMLDNATLTVENWAVYPYLKLPVTVDGTAIFNNSVLAFPGNFTVNNGILYANSTIFRAVDFASQVDDDNDDCPVMSFINSKVVFADSRVEDYYEDTTLKTTWNTLTFYSTAKSANDTTVGQSLNALRNDDDITYNVTAGQQMSVTDFYTNATLPYGFSYYGTILSAILTVSWDTNSTYDGSGYIWVGKDGSLQRTDIQPGVATSQIELVDYGFTTIEDIREMVVYFSHTGTTGTMPFDALSVEVKPLYPFNITVNGGNFTAINTYFDLDFRDGTTDDRGLHDTLVTKNGAEVRFYNVTVDESETGGAHPNFVFLPQDTSQIYLYGWLNVSSTDGNATDPTPVPYCNITAKYYAPSPEAIKITEENNTLQNGDPVLEYLNRTFPDRNINETNYNMTNAAGTGRIPLLKNLITPSDLNGQFLGNYFVRVDEHVHNTSLVQQISFSPYPNITAEDNGYRADYAFSWEYPPRDLEITPSDIAINPTPIVRGDLVWVNTTIHNIGGINITEPFNVDLLIDGVGVNTTTVTQMVERNNGTVNVSLTWQTRFGDYGLHNITIFVDSGDVISEGNESNNIVTIQRNVEALYDLSISSTDISWIPGNPYTYNNITITAIVHNTGHATITQDFVVEFFVGGSSIGTVIVTQDMLSGGTATASIQFNAPTQDIYNVSVIVDSTDIILEDDENNNGAYRLMTMNPTPDLIISEIGFYYSNPYADAGYDGAVEGTNVTITATVKNIGETYANGTITVDFYDGDPGAGGIHIGSSNIATLLDVGNTIDLSINWTAVSPYANHTIYAVVSFTENAGEPPETNTDNNGKNADITVYERPNLRFVTGGTFYDDEWNPISSIVENRTARLNVTIINDGGYPANFDVSFYDADQAGNPWIWNETDILLNSGESITISIFWAPSPMGTHNILVTIDPLNETNETNEGDNTLSETLEVVGHVDMAISNVQFSTSAPLVSDYLGVNVTVQNSGHRDINQTFTVEVLLIHIGTNIQRKESTDVEGLIRVGDTRTVTLFFYLDRSGDYTVQANLVIDDVDPTNNQVTVPLYVGPRPDYSLNPANIVYTSPAVDNHDVTITALVSNTGIAGTGTVDVYFYDDMIDDAHRIGIYSHNATTQTFTATIVWHASGVGQHTIYIRVIANTAPTEANLVSNTVEVAIDVLPRPDLTITNMTFLRNGNMINTTAGISESRDFDVNITIENIDGTLSNSHISSFVVSFFSGPYVAGDWSNLLGNMTVDNQTVMDDLDAGMQVNLTFGIEGFTFPQGTANIYAIIDSGNEVDESSETNNQFNSTITIMHVNLAISLTSVIGPTINIKEQRNIGVLGSVSDYGEPVSGITIQTWIEDEAGNVVVRGHDLRDATVTEIPVDSQGRFNAQIDVPQNPGHYRLVVAASTPDGTQAAQSISDITLQRPAETTEFPFWMVLLLVIIIVAAIVGVSLLALRKYALGKYVECGQCGKMIPAGSDKCPYCGAVFDKETVKCSACGAWIPADAQECPKCGAKFLVSGKEIVDYETQMKQQYEQFVEKFRKQAKEEMGKDYTENKFQQWWKSQKSYVTFEDWLKREEERKKTGGIICPTCGALNSKTDIVCHVCGSPLRPTKKKLKTEGIEEAAISKIELPSLEEEKEEEGEELSEEQPEEEKEEGEATSEEQPEKEAQKPSEEVKMPLAEEKKPIRPVKKVVKKVVRQPIRPPEEKAEGAENAPAVPEHLIGEVKTGEAPKPEETPEEKPAAPAPKKVVKKVVRKKVVRR